MKFKFQFLAILAVMLTITMFSCSDDEESLVGTWKTTSLVSTNCTDTEDNVAGLCETEDGVEACTALTLTFTETVLTTIMSVAVDGTTVFGPLSDASTYTTDGNTITVTDSDGEVETATFSISSDVLTITSHNNEDGCDTVIKADLQ